MPKPTPFHERTFTLCTSYDWMLWSGYYSVRRYDTAHQGEYYALRYATGLIDVTPLYKYHVKGPDAARFLSFALTRDVHDIDVGRAVYCCWCDDDGKLMDDSPVFRLAEDHFMLTPGEPAFAWFSRLAEGFNVIIDDRSDRTAVLALQGPTSKGLLSCVAEADIDSLRYYGHTAGRIAGADVLISRTGYSGDLGYEVWIDNDDALAVWDALWEKGPNFGLLPVGQDALDIARIEAGLILNNVDFTAANLCLTEHRKSTPYEMGLDKIVQLNRDPFMGQKPLSEEHRIGRKEKLVGLELNWDDLEAVYGKYGLPAAVDASSWAGGPVYGRAGRAGRTVGKITSAAWSPILKKSLALAVVQPGFVNPGTVVKVDYMLEHRRHRVKAEVVGTPFFNPERKTAQ